MNGVELLVSAFSEVGDIAKWTAGLLLFLEAFMVLAVVALATAHIHRSRKNAVGQGSGDEAVTCLMPIASNESRGKAA
jgi:hypothetical protein